MVPPVLIWLQSRHLPRQARHWRVSCLTWHRWLNRQWPRREQQQIRKPFQRMQYEAWIGEIWRHILNKKNQVERWTKKGDGKENLFKLAWDICLDKNFTSQFCLSGILLLQLDAFRCHTVSLVTCQMAIFVTLPWMNFSLPSWSYLLDLTMDHTKKTLLGTWERVHISSQNTVESIISLFQRCDILVPCKGIPKLRKRISLFLVSPPKGW